MILCACSNCGGEWFSIEPQYTLNALVFGEEGEPALEDSRHIYRCGDCREPLEVPTFDPGRVVTP